MRVNMREARSQLSQLGQLAWEGEEIVITKAGKPYLRLIPYLAAGIERKPGALEGQVWMAPDFDETPIEVVSAFEGTIED